MPDLLDPFAFAEQLHTLFEHIRTLGADRLEKDAALSIALEMIVG